MLSPLLVTLSLLLSAAGPVLAAPTPVQSNSERDLICFEAVTVTETVAVTATVYRNPSPLPSSAADEQESAATAVAPTPAVTANAVPSAAPTTDSTRPGLQQQASSAAVPDAIQSGSSSDPASSAAPDHGRQFKNVVYFTNWGIYGANYQPDQIPVKDVTHLLYAFADIMPDGEVKSSDVYADIDKHYPTDSWLDTGKNAYGCIKQIFKLKKQNRHMKVLLSIGGWTYSPKFAPVAGTEAGRQRFASTAVKILADWGFDGLDIDWEYPTNDKEARDYVLLLKACRKALDDYAAQHAQGYHFLLTVATPAGAQNYNKMDLAGMDPFVDTWNLMAYDYAGSWDSTSGHQANLYADPSNAQATKFSTEQAVRDYIKTGIAPHKIMLGLPLYGRAFEATAGVGQPYNGVGQGSIQSGVWLYKDLPRPGAAEMWDDVAGASYSYDAARRELVTYDTRRSALEKSKYLKNKGLGGAVFWEASGDRSGVESLVGTVAGQMGTLDRTQNWLSYPASQYDNIRAGLPGA